MGSSVIDDLTPTEVAERLAAQPTALLLLDVREDWERAIAAIDGAHHIPMAQLPQRLHELPRDRTIALLCHHGQRSRMAAEWLAALHEDFPHLVNVAGGIDEWSQAVDPELPRY
jgi:rhodanese-related sulfurtransferase